MFWAFSLLSVSTSCREVITILSGFDAQCFELFLYDLQRPSCKVWRKCFDAQCFELFLYMKKICSRRFVNMQVSMLNVLSFFFILDPELLTEFSNLVFRCSMFWAFSLCVRCICYYKQTSKGFRCSMFWAFSLYKNKRL